MSSHLPPTSTHTMHPQKRRRTATSVMAGDFDSRPPRDVLTSLLNGVPPYVSIGGDEEEKKARKRERERERRRERAAIQAAQSASVQDPRLNAPSEIQARLIAPLPQPSGGTSAFWRAKPRPTIHIPTMQRSVSVTPPPVTSPMMMASTPSSTPGPSSSSSTSRTSSKRPLTPDDDDEGPSTVIIPPRRNRKKRTAVKKGWKGWVEGSPPPSGKLINLDAVPVLQERRTRSGKNFDAICVGQIGWI